ncbi:MAG TPA: YHS domain-containing protein [Ignavibacteria bacterium]
MKKAIFLISIFSILALISSFSFSSDSAVKGLQDSTKCNKGKCTMGSEKCKMDSEKCKMDSEKCKMGSEKCKMDKSKCKTGGECNGTECKDCKSECGNSEKCKKNTSGGMKSSPMDSVKTCPVSGETVDGAEGAPVTYTYLGKEYTFCCEGCVKKFKAEPMNYIKEELTCPVMGEAASKDVNTVVNGVKYYFCCSGCISKFEKDPDKYLKK